MSGGALLGSAQGRCGIAMLLLSLTLSGVAAKEEARHIVLEELYDSGNEEHEEHGAEPAVAVLFPR